MEEYMPYVWLAVIVVMAIVEAGTSQLVSFWFVVGGIVALLVSVFVPTIWIQLLVFLVVTGVTLVATRPLVKKMMQFKKEDTNAGRFIGKEGFVIVNIDNEAGTGQVNVGGSIWSAKSVDGSVITKGRSVKVEEIEGVKLKVPAVY